MNLRHLRRPPLAWVLCLLWTGEMLGQSTTLLDAAGNGDVAMVRSLLASGANPDEVDNSRVKGWTPLMAAAKAGSADVAEALLKAHAKINATNEYGATALDIAITNHGKSSPVAALIESAGGKGRDVNSAKTAPKANMAAKGNSGIAHHALPATAGPYKETDLSFNADGIAIKKGGGYQETVGKNGAIEPSCSEMSLKDLTLGDRSIPLKSTAVTPSCMIQTTDYGDLLLKVNMATFSASVLVTAKQEAALKKMIAAHPSR